MLNLLGLLNLQGNLFRNVGEKILKEISLENVEVEHDFSGGLSKRVILKLSMIFLEASPRGGPTGPPHKNYGGRAFICVLCFASL